MIKEIMNLLVAVFGTLTAAMLLITAGMMVAALLGAVPLSWVGNCFNTSVFFGGLGIVALLIDTVMEGK